MIIMTPANNQYATALFFLFSTAPDFGCKSSIQLQIQFIKMAKNQLYIVNRHIQYWVKQLSVNNKWGIFSSTYSPHSVNITHQVLVNDIFHIFASYLITLTIYFCILTVNVLVYQRFVLLYNKCVNKFFYLYIYKWSDY